MGETEIEMSEAHYQPTFIAKDIEEIRQDPNQRKILKQFKLFTGQNQSHKKTSHSEITSPKSNDSKASMNLNLAPFSIKLGGESKSKQSSRGKRRNSARGIKKAAQETQNQDLISIINV